MQIYEVTVTLVVRVHADGHDDALDLVDDSIKLDPLNLTNHVDDIDSWQSNSSGGAFVRLVK